MKFSKHAALLYLHLHTAILTAKEKSEIIEELECELSKNIEPEYKNPFEELHMPSTLVNGYQYRKDNSFKDFIKGRQAKKHTSKKKKK